jgi:hypothetical protein
MLKISSTPMDGRNILSMDRDKVENYSGSIRGSDTA